MSNLHEASPSDPKPDTENKLEPWQEECQRLSDKILLGLTSKRSDEEWEHYVYRTIQLFAQKDLFKSAQGSQTPGQLVQEPTATPPTP